MPAPFPTGPCLCPVRATNRAVLVLLLLLTNGPGRAQETRPIVLERSFETTPMVGVNPLFIHHDPTRARVAALLREEQDLTKDEANLAGMLAGYSPLTTSNATPGASDQDPWLLQIVDDLRKAWNWAADKVAQPSARAEAERLLRQINTRINQLAVERQALEKAYFDQLGGSSAGSDPVATDRPFYDLAPAVRQDVLNGLRERLDSLRGNRREALDDFLLAQRRARDTGIPIADSEKMVEAVSVNGARLAELEAEAENLKKKIRTLREQIETKRALLAALAAAAADPSRLAKKELLDAETKTLTEELAKAKERAGVVDTLVKNAKLGYDPDAKERTVAAEPDSAVKRNLSAASVHFAELALRRRILQRSSREAAHLNGLADTFNAYRITAQSAQQKMEAFAKPDPKQPFDRIEHRGAYVDKAIVTLNAEEVKTEDTALAESDYFYAAAEKIKNFGGKLQTTSGMARNVRRLVDTYQIASELVSSVSAAYANILNDLVDATRNAALPDDWRMNVVGVLEKTFVKIRDKRKAADKKILFLADLRDTSISPAGLRERLELEPLPRPRNFDMFYANKHSFWTGAEPEKSALELFRLDADFYRNMDGGLRRIALAQQTNRVELLREEYVIACDKAGYTLRELTQVALSRQLIDTNTGGYNWKLLFTPVTLLTQIMEANLERLKSIPGALYVLPKELGYEQHIQRRTGEHGDMVDLFPALVKAQFDALAVAKWALGTNAAEKADLAKHVRLLWDQPEYRRFWFKAEKIYQEAKLEDANQRLAKALAAYSEQQLGNGMPAKVEDLTTRIQAIGLSGPSEGFLARAHFQDFHDKFYQFSYEDGLESLLTANELDPKVISMEMIRHVEEGLYYEQTYKTAVDAAASLADELVWDYLLGKVTEGITGFIDAKLGIESTVADVKPYAFGDTLKAVGGKVMETINGKVNPFASAIQVSDLYTKGMVNYVANQAGKTLTKMTKEHLRDTLLVQTMGVDPDWADKIFETFWTVATDASGKVAWNKLKLHETGLYRFARLSYLSAQLFEFSLRLDGKAASRSIEDALTNSEHSRFSFKRWYAKRRAAALFQTLSLSGEIAGHQAALEDAIQADPALASAPSTSAGLALAKSRLSAFYKTTPLDANLVISVLAAQDFTDSRPGPLGGERDRLAKCKRLLAGTATAEEAREAGEEAAKLFAIFGPTRMAALRKMLASEAEWSEPAAKAKLQGVMLALDAARRSLHLRSINGLVELAGNTTEEAREARAVLIRNAARIWDNQYYNKDRKGIDEEAKKKDPRRPKFEDMKPEDLDLLVKSIAAVVPTGSAGYINAQGGEYHPVRSDLDYTVLLRDDVPIEPHLRLAFETILRASFRQNSGGIKEEAFDVNFMVDRQSVFRQKNVITRDPAELLADLENGTPEQVAALGGQLASALKEMRLDFSHPERYLTNGRKASLVFQAALGQDILVRDGPDGAFVFRKKLDVMRDPTKGVTAYGEETGRLVTGQGIALGKWMALGSTVDDVAFLARKMESLLEGMRNHPEEEHPYDSLTKELSKRCIRVMMAAQSVDDADLVALNAMQDQARKGKKVDQGDLCDLMIRKIERQLDKAKGPEATRLLELRKTVAMWKDVKLGRADADDVVEGVSNRKSIPMGCEAYNRQLMAFSKDSVRALETMAAMAIEGSVDSLKPLILKQKALEARLRDLAADTRPEAVAERELVKTRKDAVDTLVDMTLDPLAVRYGDLNGYQVESSTPGEPSAVQKALIEGLKRIDVDEQSFRDRIRKWQGQARNAGLRWTEALVFLPVPLRLEAA